MDKKDWCELIERYQIQDFKSSEVIYNYWQLRKDFLECKFTKECRNCTIGKAVYY